MKAIKAIIAAGAILVLATTASATPMRWDANGHLYDVIWVETVLTWEDARDLAIQDGGHLVTLTSPEENDFLWGFLNANLPAGTEYQSYWLGGYQTEFSDEPAGFWAWVTGEEWIYAPWHSGEPNDGVGSTQHYLHYWDTQTGEWDDMENGRYMGGYVVELPDPLANTEPATLLLLGIGMIGLAGVRKVFRK